MNPEKKNSKVKQGLQTYQLQQLGLYRRLFIQSLFNDR